MESEKSHFDYFIAWDDIKHVFGLEGQTLVPSPHLAKSSLELLKSEKICGGILEYLQAEVEQRLRVAIVPAFWEYFSQSNSHNLSDTEKADIFQKVCNFILKKQNPIDVSNLPQMQKYILSPLSGQSG